MSESVPDTSDELLAWETGDVKAESSGDGVTTSASSGKSGKVPLVTQTRQVVKQFQDR